MSEKKIKDIMISLENFLTVTPSDSFEKIVTIFNKAIGSAGATGTDQTTLLVYDNNSLTGLIRISDLLEAIEPQFLKGNGYRGWTVGSEWQIPVFWEGLFTERTREALDNKTAQDILHPVQYMVEADDPLIKAVYGITRHTVNILPVQEDGRTVGMIRSQEIFHEISNLVATDETQVYALNKFIEAGKNDGWVVNSAKGN